MLRYLEIKNQLREMVESMPCLLYTSGDHLALIAQGIGLLHGFTIFAVQLDDLVDKRQFAVLKFAFDVFTHDVGRLANQIDIDHGLPSFLPSSKRLSRQALYPIISKKL